MRKTKNWLKKMLCSGLAVMLALAPAACFNRFTPKPIDEDDYYREKWGAGTFDPDVDSWRQIDPGDEDVSVTLFADYSLGDPNITNLIYRRTGVRVTFQGAMTDDHSELNTMIVGDKLPDIISLRDTSLRIQLAEEGYVYAIDRMADAYAPSLRKRISKEHEDYYRASDEHLYALGSNFYNDADIAELAELGGKQHTTVDLLVRKDHLQAFINYKTAQDSNFNPDTYCTKPSGFLEMCSWVKANRSVEGGAGSMPNTNPTVLLSPFLTIANNDVISYALTALTEFMGVPMEDPNGNYVYQYDTPEFVEVMNFLNTMYNTNLITSANTGYSLSNIDTHILNGRPFAIFGASQQYYASLARYEKEAYNAATDTVNPSHEYVSIVLTNEKGDAPLLLDYAGRGYTLLMMTKNCKRPDRVIKVIDYLMSEQGMRELTYGEVEGEYYTFKIRPGEINPKHGKPSTYGVIELTDKAKAYVSTAFSVAPVSVGLKRFSPLVNAMYYKLVSERDDYAGILTPWDWIDYKNKKTYFDYAVPRAPFKFPLDNSSRAALNDYSDRQANVEAVWIEALPKIMMANNTIVRTNGKTDMMNEYEKALALSYQKGAAEWTAFRNKCFKEHKKNIGVDYVWPKADPAYVAPAVKLFGSADRYANRPAYIYKKP